MLTGAGAAASIAAGSGRETTGGVAWLLLTLLLGLVARGALWRLALAKGSPGPGGLQIGMVEVRLAAAWALTIVFLTILGLLLVTGLLCLVYAIASAGRGFDPANAATWAGAVDNQGRLVTGAGMIAGAAALVWAAIRISLAEAASVAKGKVQVLSAWPLTRGRAAAIAFGNLCLAAMPAGAFLLTPARIGGADWFRPFAFGVVLA
ncbi:MAG TPA: hypothetical protein VGI30_06870 [Caulobacteraceae bacterium]